MFRKLSDALRPAQSAYDSEMEGLDQAIKNLQTVKIMRLARVIQELHWPKGQKRPLQFEFEVEEYLKTAECQEEITTCIEEWLNIHGDDERDFKSTEVEDKIRVLLIPKRRLGGTYDTARRESVYMDALTRARKALNRLRGIKGEIFLNDNEEEDDNRPKKKSRKKNAVSFERDGWDYMTLLQLASRSSLTMKWINWPKGNLRRKLPVWSKTEGVGRGETQLVTIFGGRVSGGGSTHDIECDDGSKWEVKELDTASSTCRFGVKGRESANDAIQELTLIVKEISNFVDRADRVGLKDVEFSSTDKEKEFVIGIVEGCRRWLDKNRNEMIVKGNVSQGRIESLLVVMTRISRLISHIEGLVRERDPLTITLGGGSPIHLSQRKFAQIVDMLEADSDDDLKAVTALNQVVAEIKSHAFDDPDVFIDRWKTMIEPEGALVGVDGLIIVSKSKGFCVVAPNHVFNEVLEVTGFVEGGRMMFRFPQHDKIPQIPFNVAMGIK